jgi:hypothetical protein
MKSKSKDHTHPVTINNNINLTNRSIASIATPLFKRNVFTTPTNINYARKNRDVITSLSSSVTGWAFKYSWALTSVPLQPRHAQSDSHLINKISL